MSKVVKHTRIKNSQIKAGHKVRTEHEHFPAGKTGYIPGSTNKPINIKLAKRR